MATETCLGGSKRSLLLLETTTAAESIVLSFLPSPLFKYFYLFISLVVPGLRFCMWDLVPQPGASNLRYPCTGVSSHWTTREVPLNPHLTGLSGQQVKQIIWRLRVWRITQAVSLVAPLHAKGRTNDSKWAVSSHIWLRSSFQCKLEAQPGPLSLFWMELCRHWLFSHWDI